MAQARTPGYQHYGVDEGLASGEVITIAEDAQGYLWVATFASGVHRFDGQVFERFGRQQGLDSLRVKRIHIDRQGRVLVGTLAGLFLFAQDRFVRDALLGNAAIYDILETATGDLWFATGDGAVRVRGGSLLRIGLAQGLPMANATALAEGRQGEVWIGTTRGLSRFHERQLSSWVAGQAGLTNDYVTRLRIDGSGTLWVATDWGLASFDGDRFRRLDLGVGELHLYVLDLLFDAQGRLRIATLGAGVLSWDGRHLGQVSRAQGLPSANVWSLANSLSGGLWIGTESHGLLLRGAGPFEPVVSTERLDSAVPQALLRTRSGELWVGTSGAGVMRLDEGALMLEPPAAPAQTLTVSDGLPSNFVRTLLADDAGLWIGTNVGVAYWDGRTATLLDPSREPWPARGLISDEAGGLWLVNKEQGLVHYKSRAPASGRPTSPIRQWHGERFPAAAEPTPGSLWSIARDRSGRLWLGATSALYCYDGLRFQRFAAAGLASTDRISQLSFDQDERLWFRSDEAIGAVDIDGLRGEVRRWSIESVPRTSWLATMPDGQVLVAAEDGLHRLRATEAGAVVTLGVVTPAQGYPRSAAQSQGVLVEAGGGLLFATTDGLYRYSPAQIRDSDPAHVHLRRLRVLDQPVPLPRVGQPLVLRHFQDHLSVDFDATAFPAPETVEFRYRLDGLSSVFSPPTTGRVAVFPHLPPGTFTVRVQARHGGGWDSEAVSGPIIILPAYWQTTWFYCLVGSLALILTVSLPLLRTRVLARQRDQLEKEVAARTAELAQYSEHLADLVAQRTVELDRTYGELLEHAAARNRAAEALADARRTAALGRLAGVVAHQVNTPLAAIKARLSLLREDLADDQSSDASLTVIGRQVDRIARTMRALLGFVRQHEIGGDNPQVAAVVQSVSELYTDALRAKGVRLTVSLPAEPLAVRGQLDDLQELLLNLVENAREAVTTGGTVRITVERSGDHVQLRVEDDGCGLGADPEQLFQPFYTTKTTGTGLGLAIARRIAEAQGGTLRGENRLPDGTGARFILTLSIVGPAGERH